MRCKLRALVGVVLIGSSCIEAAAAETGSRWWPFGRNEVDAVETGSSAASGEAVAGAAATPPQISEDPAAESEQRWMIDSRMGKVSWPRLHAPQLPRPQLTPQATHAEVPQATRTIAPEAEAARNAWAAPDREAAQPSPLQAVRNGARSVGNRTRAAWHRTVDALTPGNGSDQTSSRVARRETQSWWQRMFVADEEPSGPQTVTEWMAQDRIDH